MNDSLVVKAIAFVTGAAAAIATHVPAEFSALLGLQLIDIVTGIACGFKGHSVNSSTMGAGIRKKLGQWAIVYVTVIFTAFGLPSEATTLALGGFCLTEALSILENAKRLGVKNVPEWLTRRLTAQVIAPRSKDDVPAGPA